MYRIEGDTVAEDLFGPGKHGFQEGDPETMQPATILSAAWLNRIQEEIAIAVEASGQILDPGNPTQLAVAIQQAALSGPSSPGIDPVTLLSRTNTWTAPQTFGAAGAPGADVLFDGASAKVKGDPANPTYFRAATTRLHRKLLPLSAFASVQSATMFRVLDYAGLQLYSTSGTQTRTCVELNALVPRGCSITNIEAGVRTSPNGGGTARMHMILQRVSHVMTGSGGANTQETLFDAVAPTNGDALMPCPAMAVAVNDSQTLLLTFEGNAAADSAERDYVRYVRVQYAGYFGDEYL